MMLECHGDCKYSSDMCLKRKELSPDVDMCLFCMCFFELSNGELTIIFFVMDQLRVSICDKSHCCSIYVFIQYVDIICTF